MSTNAELSLKRRLVRSMELNGDVMSEENMRTLTDADVEAIVKAFENRLYLNMGKGVLNALWKAIVTIALGSYAIGAIKGWWK